jgi:hypothetical protein
MRILIRVFLLGSFLLTVASVCPAQRFIAHVSTPTQSGHGAGGYGSGYGSGYETAYGYSSQHHHESHGGYRSSAPRFEPTMGYAHGDADAVPSRYMSYEDALALGKRMLEEEEKEEERPKAAPAERSLGEIARQLRKASGATASEVKIAAIQDGNGQMVICRVRGASQPGGAF